MKKIVLYILMIALLIAGCGGEKQSASNKLQVAASTTVKVLKFLISLATNLEDNHPKATKRLQLSANSTTTLILHNCKRLK